MYEKNIKKIMIITNLCSPAKSDSEITNLCIISGNLSKICVNYQICVSGLIWSALGFPLLCLRTRLISFICKAQIKWWQCLLLLNSNSLLLLKVLLTSNFVFWSAWNIEMKQRTKSQIMNSLQILFKNWITNYELNKECSRLRCGCVILHKLVVWNIFRQLPSGIQYF